MSVREPFSIEENAVAVVSGAGILLAMVSGILIGFGDESDAVNTAFAAGLGLLVLGVAAWMVLLRPWEKYDDLKTPLYTGHHHDEHDEHVDEEALHELPDDVLVAFEDPLSQPTSGAVVAAVVAPETAPPIATEQDMPDEVEVATELAEPEVQEEPAPAIIVEEVDVEDDLQLIEGIGTKTEQALKEYGIKTFAAIAAYEPADLEKLVKEELSVRLVGSTVTWVRQAELAAAGELSALEDLQKRIKSGYIYDDLTQIEGIGEKSQDALYAARIRSFDDLASASIDDIQKALDKAGVSGVRYVETWAQQAQFIVDDNLTGLAAFKRNL